MLIEVPCGNVDSAYTRFLPKLGEAVRVYSCAIARVEVRFQPTGMQPRLEVKGFCDVLDEVWVMAQPIRCVIVQRR